MLGKITALLSAIFLPFVWTIPALADVLPLNPTPSPNIIVSEIYPNAPGSSESGAEFIELFNQSNALVDLTGYSLRRQGASTVQELDGKSIDAGDYLVIFPSFSLLNGGSTVYLDYPIDANNVILSTGIPYPSLDEQHSWSLVGDVWQSEVPTQGEPNPVTPVVPPPEDPPPDDPVLPPPEAVYCDISTVFINEIVANPAGADTNGGEFVELYNGGSQSVSLEGCLISTDKISNQAISPVELPSGGYYVIELSDDLLNSGGSVKFLTLNDEYEVVYPALSDDQAWAIINGVWQITEVQTPGAKNQPTPPKAEDTSLDTNKLAPCPVGKNRNPKTNRCRDIVNTVSSLLPCEPGETRNPATNRCRKTTNLISNLTPCKPGQERNPQTNRCRNIIGTSSTTTVPCQPGYERNPDTNRCRKVVGQVAGAVDFAKSEPAKLHNGILLAVSLLALAYGVFEYRFDFANWHAKLKIRFAKT